MPKRPDRCQVLLLAIFVLAVSSCSRKDVTVGQPSLTAPKGAKVDPSSVSVPKDITFSFTTGQDATFSIDRLQGFLVKLQGPDGRSVERTVVVEEGRGTCNLGLLVPGLYQMEMPNVRLITQITIPSIARRALKYEVTFGRAIGIRMVD